FRNYTFICINRYHLTVVELVGCHNRTDNAWLFEFTGNDRGVRENATLISHNGCRPFHEWNMCRGSDFAYQYGTLRKVDVRIIGLDNSYWPGCGAWATSTSGEFCLLGRLRINHQIRVEVADRLTIINIPSPKCRRIRRFEVAGEVVVNECRSKLLTQYLLFVSISYFE